MHAVGSEIWRCSGILCEDQFFVRGWRSCLRTALRREVNVLLKLVHKGNFVSLCDSSGIGTIDTTEVVRPQCAVDYQGVTLCPRGLMKGRHGGFTGMYHQHASQSSAKASVKLTAEKNSRMRGKEADTTLNVHGKA